MPIVVEALPKAEFAAWLAQRKAEASPPADAPAAAEPVPAEAGAAVQAQPVAQQPVQAGNAQV